MGMLSLAIWTPIAFGIVLLALGRDKQAQSVRWLSLVGAIVSFLVTLPLYAGFVLDTAEMQFVEKASWIERFNVNYHLGVDGISLWLVILTAFINVVVIIAGWEVITRKVNQYMAAFLILSGLMIGVFSALDGLLFYVFFEATLIPMYLINPAVPAAIGRALRPLVVLLENKYYMDWINENILARGARALGNGLWKVGDRTLIDGLLVNGSWKLVGMVSNWTRKLQTGYLYHYALVMILGIFLLMTYFVWLNK